MPFLEALTNAIAGPSNLKRSQQRGVERAYNAKLNTPDAAEELSAHGQALPSIKDSAKCSLSPGLSNDKDPDLLRITASSQNLARPNSRQRPCVQLQRSYSEQPTTSGAPISAAISSMTLLSEHMQRTHSNDSILNMPIHPLPPLPEMRGFGRYRTAVDADSQWHASKLRRQLSDVDGLIPHDTIAAMTGLTPEQLLEMNDPYRRGSVTSSKSTRSISSGTCSELYVDARTGTRISRGFSPCTSMSTHGSFGGHSCSSRKDFGLFMRTGAKEEEHGLSPSFYRNESSSATSSHRSHLLSMVNEQQTWKNALPKKMGPPCEFTSEGDPDNAVASDPEIEDEPETWEDMPNSIESRGSMLTLQIAKYGNKAADTSKHSAPRRTAPTESKPSRRGSEAVRTKTIRAGENQARRTASRTKASHLRTVRPVNNELHAKQNVTENQESKPRLPKRRSMEILCVFERDAAVLETSKPLSECGTLVEGQSTTNNGKTVVARRQRSSTIRNVVDNA